MSGGGGMGGGGGGRRERSQEAPKVEPQKDIFKD